MARRTALKARPATVARPLPPADPPDPGRDPLAELTGRELLAILEDEIQRLPAAYRLPVTLCCVEGLSRDEAARRLNATPGSVRGRVDRGRARLQARLAARGLTPAAVLALAEFARGATPPTAYTAASRVLAEGVLKAMFLTRIKVVAAALLVAVCGAGVWTRQPGTAAEEPKALPAEKPMAEKPRIPETPKPEWGEAVEGMQCRLRADRPVWAAGEWPSFAADVRYRSDRPAGEERTVWVGDTQDSFSVEIDGRWYHPTARSVPVPKAPFPTGGETAGIPVATKAGWEDAAGKAPEALAAGKHAVRVALIPIHRDSGEPMRAVSKPVEIEVRAAVVKPDANALQGRWKVVKEERPGAARTRWVERAAGADDSFTFTAGTVTWAGENSYGAYTLLLDEQKRTIEMRSLAIKGVADVQVGLYRLDGDGLTICFGGDRKPPADFTPNAPAARLCRLCRVEATLYGEWTSEQDCVGGLTVRADGTFGRTRYGPGGASLTGTWTVKWDALPPVLVLTCQTSTDKDYAGQVWEAKLTRLDAETLVCQLSKDAEVTYARVRAKPDAPAAPQLPKVQARTTRALNGGSAVIRSDTDLGRHNLTNGTAEQVKGRLAKDLGVGATDWDRQMVICVSGGQQEKGGRTVELTSLEVKDGKLVVRWKFNEAGANPDDVLPELVLLLDRFDGEVVFDPAPRHDG